MSKTGEMITIDGSLGEGGGQILRTSVALSAHTGKPLTIEKIRAGRTKPGLQAQHLTSVRAAAALCNATLTGDELGSSTLTFLPQTPVTAGDYHFDIGTAGATGLVAQTVLVPLALAEGVSNVTIIGGTHVPFAPTADYLEHIYLSLLRGHDWEARAVETKLGFFPKGGGQIRLEINKEKATFPITGFDLSERGKLVSITAYVATGGLPTHVFDRAQAELEKEMKAIGRTITCVSIAQPSLSMGAGVLIVAECEGGAGGFVALGERGKPMEKVCTEAVREFNKWWKTGASVDEHLADQLVLPAALCPISCESVWTTPVVSEHLRTVLEIVQQFIPISYTLTEKSVKKEKYWEVRLVRD
jgi:RNA 3'-terminal phosphate cyclase (ATP)